MIRNRIELSRDAMQCNAKRKKKVANRNRNRNHRESAVDPMEAIEELVQLSDSMRQAAAVLADEDVDNYKRPSTFLNVVALGNVGAGKSASLNSLIGHPVLPTGENGATRAPISIELNRDTSLSSKSIILQIDNKTQHVSASALRHSLQDRLSKGSSGRSRDEIYLKLRTSTAPPLKLIDLPGLDQRIVDDKMISEYVEHNDAILLVVVPAAQAPEISTSRALRVAKETVGIISKIDQASSEPKALAAVQALLLNQGPPKTSDIPWVALIGQSVSIASAQSGSGAPENSLETAWRAETESLKSILTGAPQSKLGRIALVESLAGQIRNRMKLRLPTLLTGLQGKSQIVQEELVKFGEQMVSSSEGTRALALQLCREFEDKFLQHLTGGEGNGWKVVASFEGNFPNRIKQLPIDRHFDINNVKRIVLEADGYQPYLISPEKGLRSLIKGVLELAKEPSRLCVDEVHRVLVDLVSASANATPGLGRYPPFKREIVAIASSALEAFKNESKKMVVALVDMERAFVPPQHFIRLVQRRMERQRREEELKNRSSKKTLDAEQSILNRATSPQTSQQSGGNLKSMKDKSSQQDRDTQEGSGLKTAGPEGEITAGYLLKKSGKGSGWSRRWFVLNEKTGKLGYTKKQEERHFRGVITLEECNIDEIPDDDEASTKNSKDKKSNGPDSGKASNLIFKITSKVPYKTVMKSESAVLLKAESMADKVEWINKLRSVAQAKGGQAIGEPSFPMRQSLSDGSLDTMARKPADPEEELRWMSQEVRGYVEAVLNSLAANVPKAVVLCQVEKAKEDMLNQLYSSVSAQSSAKIEELLQEDHNVKNKRERVQKQSALLSKLTRQLGVHDNRAAAASSWSDRGSAAESSPRSSGPSSGDDWRSAFDSAANGPSDLTSRYGSGGHSRRYSDPSQNGDVSSGSNSNSRRTPTRLPPAPPQSGKLDAYNTTSLPKPTTPPFSPLSHSMLKPIPTANAYHSYGYNYYPKLQSCVPFAPVTVPRILLRNTSFKHQIFSAIKELTLTSQLSSLHVTFPSENECHKLTEKGFLPRIGMQYHWKNRNYKNLDDFLMDMKQSKRKNIRQECKKISAQNLIMKRLRGYLIKARHWDSFYTFYRNTTDNKWGTPHLTREFFHELGAKMGDNVLLVVAEEGDELVAGALNLIGGDTLFGRLWGCQPRSYYQAIEAAIELNLKTVEAGAQGEHKIQRNVCTAEVMNTLAIWFEDEWSMNLPYLVDDAAFLPWTWLRNLEKDFSTHFNQWSGDLRAGRRRMIVRTPPPPKRPRADGDDGQLVIYEDPPESSPPSEQMLCTYQCRQMVKSDFIDALSKAENQARHYQSKFETLEPHFRKVESERKKFQDQFLYAQQELAAAKGREQALQDQLLKEATQSQERLRKQIQLNTQLQVKLQNETDLRQKADSHAASTEEKAASLEGKLGHLSESIEREKKRLHDEHSQLKSDSNLSISRISANLEQMECRANNAEKEAELLKEQLKHLKDQLDECLHQKIEVEKKLSTLMSQEVASTESNVLVKHLQQELRNYESEVREARKLSSSHENIELLKEKILEEKSHRERAESELSKLQDIQLNMKKLEDQISSWRVMITDIPGVSCFEDLPVKFAALQKEVIYGTQKEGEITARLKQMEVALDAAEIGKQNAEAEAELAKDKAEVLKSEIKGIELMLAVVTEERNKLRNFANLKNDETLDASKNANSVQEPESSLMKKDDCVKDLESTLHEQRLVNNCQLEEIKLLNEKLHSEARRVKSLERESDRLRSEISLLEAKLGHGDFSAANTKVLRMVNTLTVDNEAKQTIEALQTELQKTKEKLKAVEELKSQSGEAGKLVDSYISDKMLQLKEQIATLEKREERYKTVFADRISVFRRACCELFGYKIVMDEHQRSNGIPVTRFTLQSIYAQSDDEKLEFEYESGNTNILANHYTSQPEVSRQVEIFIRKMNSIPAFTANITVESFNRRTFSGIWSASKDVTTGHILYPDIVRWNFGRVDLLRFIFFVPVTFYFMTISVVAMMQGIGACTLYSNSSTGKNPILFPVILFSPRFLSLLYECSHHEANEIKDKKIDNKSLSQILKLCVYGYYLLQLEFGAHFNKCGANGGGSSKTQNSGEVEGNEVPRVSSFVVINLASALYEIWHFMIERLNFLNHDLIFSITRSFSWTNTFSFLVSILKEMNGDESLA
ncbi:Dynamin-2B [Glycine soja]